jgi:cellulase/cellobiase CelA1
MVQTVIIKGSISHPDTGHGMKGRVKQYLDPMCHVCWVGWEEHGAVGLKVSVICVDDRDGFVRKEAIVSFVEHSGCVVAHDWLCLNM